MMFAGYQGRLCEDNPDNCAGVDCNSGECVDGLGEFVCQCPEEYTGIYCKVN